MFIRYSRTKGQTAILTLIKGMKDNADNDN